MTRRLDWPERIDAVIRSHSGAAFEYGAHDCVLFAADVVDALTGSDPASDVRGSYDAQTLRQVYRKTGGVERAIAARLTCEISPMLATTGDIGISGKGAKCFACVCAGGGAWLAPAPHGVEAIDPSHVRRAWRI